ncbi:MAG: methyltransferase, TrmH family, group 3 [Acidobacteria bacterium]|nr:methyltransferase, TrmH family, group 3 [Acidobacteriota bacterium]
MQEAVRLQEPRGRAESGRALLEGPNLLAEALSAGVRVEQVFALAEDAVSVGMAAACGAELIVVDDRALRRLATTEHPQSPVAVMVIPPVPPPAPSHLLVAWGVGDPGNVGSLIRCASAFGFGFAAGPGTADPWAPKVLRAAAGGHFRAGVGRAGSLDELRSGGRRLVATVARGGMHPAALPPGPMAVLVGDEAHGLPADVVEACDLAVTIPMPGGAESLNAAVAGAIVAYEVAAGGRAAGD